MNIQGRPIPSDREIFLVAIKIADEQERVAFLDRACGGDCQRRGKLEGLLAADVRKIAGPLTAAVRTVGSDKTRAADHDVSLDFDISTHPTIDRYKLLEQIGEGGMGTVFMAQQTEPVKRMVALKLIKRGMDSHNVIARFEAERQALAMMEHSNIAHVLDAGTTETGRPYFVMELVRGVPITDYCDQASFSISDRLRLFVDVCRAVQHAHQKGIIHRDLKPSNVLVTLHDSEPVVKVIDFGVAKALNQELTERTLFTHFSQMIGTPLYMSPEQAELSGLNVDTRSDVYSLGVLLYELLTGTTPFDNAMLWKGGFDGMRRIIREDEPPRPSHRVSTLEAQLLSTVSHHRRADPRRLSLSLQRELDWIAMRALEKDRNRRYESASALATDVQRYLHDEPVQACPPSVRYRMKKAATRHRGALIASVLILAVLLGGTTVSIWQAVRAGHALRLADARFLQAQIQQHIAERQTRLARSERDRASRANAKAQTLLYTSDMRLASDAIASEDLPRAADLLRRHIPAGPERDLRGFEWYFFQKRVAGPDRITIELDDWIHDISSSPDGKRLAATAARGGLRIYDTETWQVQQELITGAESVNAMAWSRDGRLLAAACADGRLRVWDASTGEAQTKIPSHRGEARDVIFSRDGLTLYSCGDDHLACGWNIKTGELRMTFSGHQREVTQIALSPDGKTLATACSDGTFGIWDAATAKRLHLITRANTRVTCVAFSPDNRWIAAGDIHGGIYLADRETGKGGELTQQLDGIEALVFVPGGAQLATADRGGAIQLHQVLLSAGDASPAPGPSPRWIAHQGRALTIAVSPDGSQIFSGGRDGLLRIWQPDPQAYRWSLEMPLANDFATGPGDQCYAVGKTIEQWDLKERRLVRSLAPSESPWLCAECSADTRTLAVARRGQLALLDTASQNLRRAWSLAEGLDPYRLAVSPDGRLAALADYTDRSVILLFDVDSEQPPRRLTAMQCECLAFSPDGTGLAAGHRDDLLVYDLQGDGPPNVLRGHSNTLAGVAFSPDGKSLATVSHDRLLKIWDPASGEELFSVVAHRNRVSGVVFSPDGRTIVTAGFDGFVNLWHTRTGQSLGTVASEGDWIGKIRFSADGRQLANRLAIDTFVIYDASAPAVPWTVANGPVN